jgi:hypothetical protein
MSTDPPTTVKLGDLVVAAFDWAAQHGSDVREVRILGVKAVSYLLRVAGHHRPPVLRPVSCRCGAPVSGSCSWKPAAVPACRPR